MASTSPADLTPCATVPFIVTGPPLPAYCSTFRYKPASPSRCRVTDELPRLRLVALLLRPHVKAAVATTRPALSCKTALAHCCLPSGHGRASAAALRAAAPSLSLLLLPARPPLWLLNRASHEPALCASEPPPLSLWYGRPLKFLLCMGK